jgi:hypothetical protein
LSRFKGGALNLSPLKLQLTPDGNSVVLVEWRAALQAEIGVSWSRPQISRPSTLGTSFTKPSSVPIDNPAGVATASVISQFATQPTLPAATAFTPNSVSTYVSYQWQSSEREGPIAYAGDALLLYALAGVGATWDAEIVWEEP